MKRILKSFLFLLASLPVYAQVDDVENLMTRRYLSCVDILYNVSWLIPEFYEKGNKDTLQAIITYWEDKCKFSEERTRCKILFSIDDNTFNENMLDDDDILKMLRICERITQHDKKRGYWDRWDYHGNFPFDNEPDERLKNFIATLSKTLLETKELLSVEKFILHIYANNFEQAYQMLDSDELNETRIKELHHQRQKVFEQDAYFHNDWMFGAWIPQGNLDLLGVHPFIGYRFGLKVKKLTTDISFGFKFIKSPEIYQVYKDNTIWDTDYFAGIYFGLDAGYELFRFGKNSIDIIGGIAYENINTLDEKNENCCDCCSNNNNKITHNLNSLNLNIGLGYKFYFNGQRSNQRYLGLDFKYNYVNFKNPRGTNLDGNIFTVNLIIGNVISDLFDNF